MHAPHTFPSRANRSKSDFETYQAEVDLAILFRASARFNEHLSRNGQKTDDALSADDAPSLMMRIAHDALSLMMRYRCCRAIAAVALSADDALQAMHDSTFSVVNRHRHDLQCGFARADLHRLNQRLLLNWCVIHILLSRRFCRKR